MRKERISWLTDEETDFPLPLYPTMEAPTVYTKHGEPYHTDPDAHHFFFPKKVFTDNNLPPGGRVVRLSRVQTVRRRHHDLAHKIMAPPDEIIDPTKQFGLSVLALSNYIPRQAIDVRSEEPIVVGLNDEEYSLLQEMTKVDFVNAYHSTIGKFFISIMLENYCEVIDDSLRCQFLEAKHDKNRRELGRLIIKAMSREAVSDINPVIWNAKQHGEVPQTQVSPYKIVTTFTAKVKNNHRYLAEALAVA